VIAKIPPKRKDGKSSFQEIIGYIRGKDGERAVYVGFQGVSSAESAALEMETAAFTNVRCKDPVFHFILSWRELEYPTNEQADEAVKDRPHGTGFTELPGALGAPGGHGEPARPRGGQPDRPGDRQSDSARRELDP
jgi:hypothetical protein